MNNTLKQLIYGLLSFIIVFVVVGNISFRVFTTVLDPLTDNFFDELSTRMQFIGTRILYVIPGLLALIPIIYSFIKKKWGIMIGSLLAIALIYLIGFTLYAAISDDDFRSDVNQELADQKMQQIFETLAPDDGSRIEYNGQFIAQINQMLKTFKYNQPLCSASLNQDPPNEWISVTDTRGEISFSVPYNQAWGNQYIKLNPVDGLSGSNSLSFGPLQIFGEGGCSWMRPGVLSFLEKKSAAQVMANLKQDKYLFSRGSSSPSTPRIKWLKNRQVVPYVSHGFCSYANVIVIGRERNYIFTSTCGGEAALPNLEKMAASIKFL